jgi:hypothetical protein
VPREVRPLVPVRPLPHAPANGSHSPLRSREAQAPSMPVAPAAACRQRPGSGAVPVRIDRCGSDCGGKQRQAGDDCAVLQRAEAAQTLSAPSGLTSSRNIDPQPAQPFQGACTLLTPLALYPL